MGLGSWVQGLGCGVWGLGFGVWGLGLGVWGVGFGVWSSGFGVQDSGFRVQGSGFRVQGKEFGAMPTLILFTVTLLDGLVTLSIGRMVPLDRASFAPLQSEMLLQVGICVVVFIPLGPVRNQHRHEVGTPYPGALFDNSTCK